jgi:hypothetical protein
MIFISMKRINILTIFCCNMFHDQGKFLQQKDLNTRFAFFNSSLKKIRTQKNKFLNQKKIIYYLWGKKSYGCRIRCYELKHLS